MTDGDGDEAKAEVLERGVAPDERRAQAEVIREPREDALVQRRQFAVLRLRIAAVDARED